MSIEFRLKYIRDAIDKNINEILLKWNAKKVLLNESFDEDAKELCAACQAAGKQRFLKYCYVNLDEAVYKCESAACLYPFRNFKYKNYADRTIFRYERIMETAGSKNEQQTFTSPTKIENDDIDEFNISWLDDDTDLDSILAAPSERQQTCDIKDIINNICNDAATTSATLTSPVRIKSGQLLKAPTPKLSKCLEYMEHCALTEQSHSNRMDVITPTRQTVHPVTSKKSTAVKRISSALKPKFKPFKNIRNGFRKTGDLKPVQAIVQQQPLGFLEWLDVVSKTEPDKMREFEVASPAECSGSSQAQVQATANKETSSEPVSQPILIEYLGTSESYSLDGNQSSKAGESCLLYQLDPNQLQTTSNHVETQPNDYPMDQTTTEAESDAQITSSQIEALLNDYPMDEIPTESLENNSTGEQIRIDANVEDLNFASGDSSSSEFKTIKIESGSHLLIKQDATSTSTVKTKQAKAKPKDKMKQSKEKPKSKKQKQKVVAPVAPRKSFNIEVEERFLGFELIEPFQPIPLRKKELVWLKLE